jgi:hypothetical protein
MSDEREIEAIVGEIAGIVGQPVYADDYGILVAARLILAARQKRDEARSLFDFCAKNAKAWENRADALTAERDAAREEAEDCHAKWLDEAEKRQEATRQWQDALAELAELEAEGEANRRLRAAVEYAVEQDRDNADWNGADCFRHIVAALRGDGEG